ncbi:MAG: ABC transporter substrate-binding protein, partial [Deltaproteobacteria bacterium]|nr:ABC transporter substrate-binding protein [Deltaproteobacteria bacterium]
MASLRDRESMAVASPEPASSNFTGVIDGPLQRRTLLKMMAVGAGALAWPAGMAYGQSGEKVLRIAMTLSDIPVTTGQASGGAEGGRFINRSIYDALLTWDLSQADKPSGLLPNLAMSWSVDPKNRNRWTFNLRKDVKFHDGSQFTAHDVLWNFEKSMNPNAAHYDRLQARNAANWLVSVKSARAIDDFTLEVTTKRPNGTLLYELVNIFYSSPRQWEKLGRDWTKVAFEPSGTGPYKLVLLVPRNRAELVRNADYWNKSMVPQHDRMVLRPMPDANTRVSALLSGQVDLVEALPPDAVPTVKGAGMQVTTNVYPHIWPYMVSHLKSSPFSDIRIRKAANLAIDRENLTKFLGGLAVPAQGMVTPDHPWFGNPTFKVKYDPDGARKLMAEAGYSKSNPVNVNVTMSAAGSGQMQPLPMNEFIQENF